MELVLEEMFQNYSNFEKLIKIELISHLWGKKANKLELLVISQLFYFRLVRNGTKSQFIRRNNEINIKIINYCHTFLINYDFRYSV